MMQPSCPGLSLVTRDGFTVMTLKQSNNLPNGESKLNETKKDELL
jgi:hypothetical protein